MSISPIRVIITGVDQFSNILANSQKSMEKFGKSMQRVGRTMTMAVTLPILAFGASSLKVAGDFEASMKRVEVLTSATGEQFVALNKQAKQLGATTKFTASEAGDAMGFLAMAGFKTDQILSAMPGTLALAAAGNMEIARTADLASNIMTDFNIKATEMNRVADVLAETMSSSNTNIEQLAEGMKFVAPVASGLGISLEETAAAMGFLGNAGIQGAMGGTSLRMSLAKLIKPTRETVDTLQRLGIPKDALMTAEGQLRGIVPLMKELERAGATTTDMIRIFGIRSGPSMAAMLTQGAGALEAYVKQVENSQGRSQQIAAKVTEGLKGELFNLRSAVEAFQLALLDTGVLTSVTKFLQKLTTFFRKIAEAQPKMLKFGIAFALAFAVIGPILLIVGKLVVMMASLSAIIAKAGGIVALLSNPVGWVIAAILALIALAALMKMKFGMSFKSIMAGFLLLSGPIGWIAALFIKNWSRILPYIKLMGFAMAKLGELILYIFWPVFKLFEKIGDLFGWVSNLLLGLLDGITKLVLPKWLEQKIGLTAGEGSAPSAAAITQQVSAASVNKNENKTTIRVENRANAQIYAETEEGDLDMELDRGFAFEY